MPVVRQHTSDPYPPLKYRKTPQECLEQDIIPFLDPFLDPELHYDLQGLTQALVKNTRPDTTGTVTYYVPYYTADEFDATATKFQTRR